MENYALRPETLIANSKVVHMMSFLNLLQRYSNEGNEGNSYAKN